MEEIINGIILDETLCRDAEDIMILSALKEEEQRLSAPISGNISCLNLILTLAAITVYTMVNLLL